jgi:hypothetical protein
VTRVGLPSDPVTASDFERSFAELVRAHAARADNHGCVACRDCERCTDCTFCARSQGLSRCHYCVESAELTDCTHCHRSRGLVACTHCGDCERCLRSAYLERCVDCIDCHYCFGCVGLSGREFCILNEPLERSRYFERAAELARMLGRG